MPALLKSKPMRYIKREAAILHGTFHGRLYGFGTDLKAVSKFEVLLIFFIPSFYYNILYEVLLFLSKL